jgi:hypothetical protein
MKIAKNEGILMLTMVILLSITAMAPLMGAVKGDAPPSTPTSITLSLSTKSVTLGNNLTVSGSITPSVSGFPPVSGVTVTLTYTRPDGTTLTRTVASGTDGSFSDTYTPNVAGSWSVEASWAGNANYLGATSFAEDFTATNPSENGISTVYLYAAAAIAIIAIVAVAAYLYLKKK